MVLQRSQKKEKITVSSKEAYPNAFKERGFPWNRHFILENKTKNHKYKYIKNAINSGDYLPVTALLFSFFPQNSQCSFKEQKGKQLEGYMTVRPFYHIFAVKGSQGIFLA